MRHHVVGGDSGNLPPQGYATCRTVAAGLVTYVALDGIVLEGDIIAPPGNTSTPTPGILRRDICIFMDVNF